MSMSASQMVGSLPALLEKGKVLTFKESIVMTRATFTLGVEMVSTSGIPLDSSLERST